MGRDRSLDEFLRQSDTIPDGEADSETLDADDAGLDREGSREIEGEGEGEGDEQPSTLTIHPARSTMAWTEEGATCDVCEEVVQRRWRDDEQLVCGACKEW